MTTYTEPKTRSLQRLAAWSCAWMLVAALGCGSDDSPTTSSRTPKPTPSGTSTETPSTPAQPAVEPGGWGDVKLRFVYDGSVPTQPKLNVDKDKEVCSAVPPLDERLVVGSDGSLANVMVYIRDDVPAAQIHEDYAATAKDKVKVTNKGCRFEPHVTLMRSGQTLVLGNNDSIPHNVKALLPPDVEFNPTVLGNSESEVDGSDSWKKMSRVGELSCGIHPWMRAYMMLTDHPYAAVSAADGTITLKNVPTGEWEFQLWQEQSGYVGGVTVGDQKANKRGRVKLVVHPGDNDFGDIQVPASLFEE